MSILGCSRNTILICSKTLTDSIFYLSVPWRLLSPGGKASPLPKETPACLTCNSRVGTGEDHLCILPAGRQHHWMRK